MDLFRVCEELEGIIRELGLHAAEIKIEGPQIEGSVEVKDLVVKFTRVYGIPNQKMKNMLIEKMKRHLDETEWKVSKVYEKTDEKEIKEVGITIDLHS